MEVALVIGTQRHGIAHLADEAAIRVVIEEAHNEELAIPLHDGFLSSLAQH